MNPTDLKKDWDILMRMAAMEQQMLDMEQTIDFQIAKNNAIIAYLKRELAAVQSKSTL